MSVWGLVKRVAAVALLPMALTGCLNAASGDNKPPGSMEALEAAKKDEVGMRKLIADALAHSTRITGGPFGGPYRTKNATLAGPHIQQDPLTKAWAIFYCVKADLDAALRPPFKAQAIVARGATGWELSTSIATYEIGCWVNPRPFPEFDALTNKLAAEKGQ